MGSTTVTLDGKGFEASDAVLEIWLALLVRELDRWPDPPPWLGEVRDEWELQATAGFDFGVMPQLDEFATDAERRATLIAVSKNGLQALESMGETITCEQLNDMGTGGEDSYFTEDLPTEQFKRLARYFIKLLEGQLGPDEIDSRF